MGGEISLGDALAKMFWFMGELAFKFIPGTVASIAGIDGSGTGPIPAGFSTITEPVTVANVVSFLEKTATLEQYASTVHTWNIFVTFSMAISLLLSTGVIYCIIRIRQI